MRIMGLLYRFNDFALFDSEKDKGLLKYASIILKKSLIVALGLLLPFSAFSQSETVLEPVGRYIYQASQKDFTGTDHLLNAVGLSEGRILINSVGLVIVDSESMSISGSTDYIMRSQRGGGRDVAVYKDTYLYINNHQSEGKTSTTGFGISKITDSEIVSVKTITETDVFFEKLNVYGDFLYAAAHNKGIRIYSLSDPENPNLIGSLTEGFTDVFDMALEGDTLYVADGGGGLKVVDISNPAVPVIVSGETTSTAIGTAQDIEVRDGRVYLACGGAGICVYEKGNLSTRTVYPLTGCTEDVCWVGNYLAASTFGGVSVFEVGDGTLITKVASEKTSRYNQKAYIRTAFGVGAANDSTLMVACWNSVDCYRIKPIAKSKVPDITCSTQRIRFPAAGGSEIHFIVNQGGATLTIDNVSTLTGDFSTTLVPQSVEPGDTLYFDVTYAAGIETEGQTLYLSSNDPDENPLPIQVYGNTSSLDIGEEVPDFTLSTLYTNPETGVYTEEEFTLSDQRGKVVWIQMFGTWCPACPSAEADMQNTIIKEFADNPDVETFVLNENQQERDPIDWIQDWTTKFYQRGPMLYDADGTVGGEILSQPKVGNMPFGRGFIIDQEGKVAKSFFGHKPQMAIATIYDLLGNYTSIEDVETKKNLVNVYPNPVVDILKIALPKEIKNATVYIYNTAGMEEKRVVASNVQNIEVNFSDMHKGIYFLRIFTGEEVFIAKVLK